MDQEININREQPSAVQNVTQVNPKKFWIKLSKKILIGFSISIALSLLLVAGSYFYYTSYHKAASKNYPEVIVKNNGWDPAKPEDKLRLDSYVLYSTSLDMIKAKIKMKQLSAINLSGIDGGDFVIYDFRDKNDYDKGNLDGSINVTPETYLERLDQQDTQATVFLVSYEEKNEDINWATRAALMQGHFNPIGLKNGIPKEEK
jgi:hypothetical protein